MASSNASLNFLDLPHDILLEILGNLPAFSVVLRCRLVCHKFEHMSRENHLWVKFFHSTKYMLRRPIDLSQIGTSQFEISICRAQMLEERWDDEDALWIVPRFWRGTVLYPEHGRCPIAIMGDYIVVQEGESFFWIHIDNLDGLPISTFTHPAVTGPMWQRMACMDPMTSTFYLISFDLENSVNVMGIQANSHGAYVAMEYSLALHVGYGSRSVARVPVDGFVVVCHRSRGGNPAVDIIDLRKRTVSYFTFLPMKLYLPASMHDLPLRSGKLLATETHLIDILNGGQAFVIFKRLCTSQEAHSSNPSLQEPTTPAVVLKGSFPWPIFGHPHIIPRSPTSFVMVAMPPGKHRIHVFLFALLETEPSFREICFVDVPGQLIKFILSIPPITARYALGVLATEQAEHGVFREQMHFAVRIDFPDPEWDQSQEKQECITLRRMHLMPAVNVEKEKVRLRDFDCFSGKICFYVHSGNSRSDLVVDYLS